MTVDDAFPEFISRVNRDNCPFCKKSMKGQMFRDKLSFQEFTLFGLCQECQDKVFKGEV